MKARQVVFTKPNEVELQSFEFDVDDLGPRDVVIENRYSLISPGTELACLRGTESWAGLPFQPGYAGCGNVLATGSEVKDLNLGASVFSYTKHASIGKGRTLVSQIPEGLDPKRACFARMAAVSITALRVSDAELGDHVAVIGLGLVGNLCAQLFSLAGCQVIGIDASPARCEIASACGVPHVLSAPVQEARSTVSDLTGGRMCATVVEAIGAPAVGAVAAELAGKLGEVILLGSPRGVHTGDVTQVLNQVHLWGSGCVTFKGAHEWRYPTERDESGRVKHSIERNVEILMQLIAGGRLYVDELITHTLSPEACASAYAGLRDKKDAYMGVLFDWAS